MLSEYQGQTAAFEQIRPNVESKKKKKTPEPQKKPPLDNLQRGI